MKKKSIELKEEELMSIAYDIARVTGKLIRKQEGESLAMFGEKLLIAIDYMDESRWKKLTRKTKNWYNLFCEEEEEK